MNLTEMKLDILRFANKHKLIFEDSGEIGFGRDCIGLLSRAGAYVDYNPQEYYGGDFIEPVPRDDRLSPPYDLVSDAYHKHSCLAVLVHNDDYDLAINQLYSWIDYLEAQGEVKIVSYDRHHDNDFSLWMHGPIGYAIVIEG